MEQLGARLYALRRIHGWSKAELARRLLVSPVTVANWEKGVTKPTADKLVLLKYLFKVGYDFILEGSGESAV